MTDIPTKTQPMREAIILALAKLQESRDEDEGSLASEIQFWIANLSGRPDRADDFDDRSPEGKAYRRAIAQLQEEGIVVIHPNDPNGIERILAIYL